MTGGVAFQFGVLKRWRAPRPPAFPQWTALVSRTGAWAAVCLLLVAPMRLYTQARGLAPPGDPVPPMMANVLRTTWGHGWLLQVVAAVVTLAAFLLANRGSAAGWWLALASVVCVTASPALMGHAVAAEHYLVVSLFSDWLHVAMAGSWVGALTMLTLIVRSPDHAGSGAEETTATLIELFHPVALTGATVLTATGVVSLLLRVDHVVDLLHSAYGAILAAKLALTLGVAVLGWRHSRGAAQMARAGGARALRRSLAAEVALAAAVITVTAVLVATAPPMP